MRRNDFRLLVNSVMVIWMEKVTGTRGQPQYGNKSELHIREIYLPFERRPTSTELPVSFSAPHVRSQDFWNGPPERRTFGNFVPPKTDLNSFFDFMLDAGGLFKPVPPKERFRYEPPPFMYRSSTESNFLPPPKPIRASIVKLEAVTRPTIHPLPFEYPITGRNRPLYLERPDTFHIDGLGFSGRPERVTSYPKFPYEIAYATDMNADSVKKGPSPTEFERNPEVTSNSNKGLESEEPKDPKIVRNPTKGETDNDQQTKLVLKDSVSRYSGMNENAAANDQKTNSIKIVTDLTLEGLQKNTETANVPRYMKYHNMSMLIDYELNKWKQNHEASPRIYGDFTTPLYLGDERLTTIDTNDHLSLDLRILKDTDWDGFTTETVTTTDVTAATETGGSTRESTTLPTSGIASTRLEQKGRFGNETIVVETRVTKTVTRARGGNHQSNSTESNSVPLTREVTTKGVEEGFGNYAEVSHQTSTEISHPPKSETRKGKQRRWNRRRKYRPKSPTPDNLDINDSESQLGEWKKVEGIRQGVREGEVAKDVQIRSNVNKKTKDTQQTGDPMKRKRKRAGKSKRRRHSKRQHETSAAEEVKGREATRKSVKA